jgi:P-type conjugative transfer protein TrbJ
MRSTMKMMAVAAAASCVLVVPAHAVFGVGDVVYDPANHAENILSAVRALEEVEQQIQQLQNEAQMIAHQARNLEGIDFSSAPELQAAIVRMRGLIDRAEGIAFEIAETEAAWARDYPESYAALDHDAMVVNARAQWANARHAVGTALTMQAEVVALVDDDAATLDRLLAESQSASGNLDATQATNELVGLSVAQGLRTQQLLAAQARSVALEQARALEEAEAARVRRARFLGDGDAYGPGS